ncbi:5-formyltetrahydrofolate cyclo-ligase [Halobacteriovorax sp.]|uniref:5-formyltetrahydrofolate cyclo-ligase n=1 Tax=Halobacteriovorax sp. TaxID=2020862 RepID=UPI00356948E0
MNKEKLRKELRTVLSKIDNVQRSEKAKLCLVNLIKLLRSQGLLSKNIILGLFAPLEDEINIISGVGKEIKTLAFPSINECGEMVFRESRFEDLVENTSFKVKILEPSLSNKIVQPDILLVPGLAFGREGQRLGRGRGYYDRYLENYKCITIGLGFNDQLITEIPMEEHDCHLNWVVTDSEVIKV